MTSSGTAAPVPTARIGTGRIKGAASDGVAVFLGIPFAQPPVGDRRLAAPAPPRRWDGVRECVRFGSPPPQSRVMGAAPGLDDNDDWLTVNVWTPDAGTGGLPVIVWIQGGGYVYGWSGDPAFDGAVLARDGNVVVTFNYRLSAEGFGQFVGAPANRGLLDQVAALTWVRENIAQFGGDADRVTIMGESAGAGCVAALLVMPAAEGLFRRAVAQSVPGLYYTPALAADIAAAVAARLGVSPSAPEVAALPPSRLNDAADAVAAAMPGVGRWGRAALAQAVVAPVVDGEVLPVSPLQGLGDVASGDVELVVGHTADEYRLFMAVRGELGSIGASEAAAAVRALAPDPAAFVQAHPDAGPELLFERVYSDWLFRMPSLRLADLHQRRAGTFLYELTWPAPGLGGHLLGACHGLGVPLSFGTLTSPTAAFLLGSEPDDVAQSLSARVRRAWSRFVAMGDPGWPRYDVNDRLTWMIDVEDAVTTYREEPARQLWSTHGFAPLDLDER